MAYLIFNIRLTGSASGWAFNRVGRLALSPTVSRYGTQNGVNPYDALIVSGNVFAGGGSGAISFATNSFLMGGRAAIDMAFVSYNSKTGTLQIQVDGRLGQTYSNMFTVKDGLLATPWAVQGGTAAIQIGKQSVSGYLNLQGRGAYWGGASYYATFSGAYVGQSAFPPKG